MNEPTTYLPDGVCCLKPLRTRSCLSAHPCLAQPLCLRMVHGAQLMLKRCLRHGDLGADVFQAIHSVSWPSPSLKRICSRSWNHRSWGRWEDARVHGVCAEHVTEGAGTVSGLAWARRDSHGQALPQPSSSTGRKVGLRGNREAFRAL